MVVPPRVGEKKCLYHRFFGGVRFLRIFQVLAWYQDLYNLVVYFKKASKVSTE